MIRRLCTLFAVSAAIAACATTSPLVRQQCYDADAQLGRILRPLDELRVKGCDTPTRGTSECDRLRQELDRLVVICPGHVPTLMADAAVAYDDHQPVKAQQLLDQILSQPGIFPAAAVLRARIGIEEGNLPYARRLLEQQIKLAPDHAGLHETYGGALYLDKQLQEAARQLTIAAALGAPRWRIAYHLGLVDEAAGRLAAARQHYVDALADNPGWEPARSRLNAMSAELNANP